MFCPGLALTYFYPILCNAYIYNKEYLRYDVSVKFHNITQKTDTAIMKKLQFTFSKIGKPDKKIRIFK